MARKFGGRYNRNTGRRLIRRKRKRKSKYTEVEKIAYRMGQVERGRKNSNSRISESYANGLKEKPAKEKKTLF